MQDYTIPISSRWIRKSIIMLLMVFVLVGVFTEIGLYISDGSGIFTAENIRLYGIAMASFFLIPPLLFSLFFHFTGKYLHQRARYVFSEKGLGVEEDWWFLRAQARKRVIPYSAFHRVKIRPDFLDPTLDLKTIELSYDSSRYNNLDMLAWMLGGGRSMDMHLSSIGATLSPALFPVESDRAQEVMHQIQARVPKLKIE